jgi:hypothetical protein
MKSPSRLEAFSVVVVKPVSDDVLFEINQDGIDLSFGILAAGSVSSPGFITEIVTLEDALLDLPSLTTSVAV